MLLSFVLAVSALAQEPPAESAPAIAPTDDAAAATPTDASPADAADTGSADAPEPMAEAAPSLGFDLFAVSFTPHIERKVRPLETDDAIIGMIRSTIDGEVPGLRADCWQARLTGFPELYGTWQIDLLVHADGTASDVTITPVDVPDSQMEACLATHAAAWSFLPIVADTPAARRVRFGEPSPEDLPDEPDEPDVVDVPN